MAPEVPANAIILLQNSLLRPDVMSIFKGNLRLGVRGAFF